MMINPNEKKKEVLENEYVNEIINSINIIYEKDIKVFLLIDLIDGFDDTYYRRYFIKGVLFLLLYLDYIKIVGTTRGTNNFIYYVNKKITL